jgi:hypothetical protein
LYWKRLEVLVGYLGMVALLGVVLPGPSVAGAALEDKSRLTYKCNGKETAKLQRELLLQFYLICHKGLWSLG